MGLGFPQFGAVPTRGTTVLVPGLSELLIYGGINDAGMGPYPPRVALVLRTPRWGLTRSQWSWGFYSVRGGIDPGDRRFSPRFIGVVHV